MPRNWTNIAERSDIYTESDFRSAAYQLLCAQVLYDADQTQRIAYRLITSFRNEFEEAFKLFGMNLLFDDSARYVAAVPEGASRRTRLTLQESQLVLVLRKLYHEQANRGALEEGVATVSIDELRSAFQAAASRELPTSAKEIGALIEQMHRFGIAKRRTTDSSDLQPFDVAILPGIQTLVNEATLMRLAAHYHEAAALAALRKEGKAADGKGAGGSAEAPVGTEAVAQDAQGEPTDGNDTALAIDVRVGDQEEA